MSEHEQAVEIGRFVIEHGHRRKEYVVLSERLKRIGVGLQQAVAGLINADAVGYSKNTFNAKVALEAVHPEVDLSALIKLIEEHVHLTEHLIRDQETLKKFGI